MKIVINAFSARLGGGRTYLLNLFEHIPASSDLEILVFAPPNLELPAHPSLRRVETTWPTENPILRTLWEKWVLPRILKREQADVLFCPGGVVATVPPRGCKVATMFRNMIPFDSRVQKNIPFGLQRIRVWLLNRVMLKSMANADLTIFISEYARGVIESLTNIRHAVTIPHGISSLFRTHGRSIARPEFAPDSEYLLYVSRFDVYKHHYEVVTAYASLPPVLRSRHPLVLVGETNMPEADRVKSLIRALGLENNVIVLGAIPYKSLPAMYHFSYLNIFASSCENCPNIMLEALASGRPLISSDVMPMPEFGGQAVMYFSPFDHNSIADALLTSLTSPDAMRNLSIGAVNQSDKFNWAISCKTTWDELTKLSTAPVQGS
ncbi:glycosyltransferase family 4 protein [Pseudomonas quasicaspiana]|uniref:glycosyltransferase family 4 protein n=1 Tax=Pseudomonas quasicaspiana TaxID=2829821 RepID=UPI001E2BC67D|nr:glycosyltransferase family 1 protein [Pseudomonas quasicaspiana]MCD5978829.1 glycosyltransferase family 4 protein [Pseudomonas quasicaspiana]